MLLNSEINGSTKARAVYSEFSHATSLDSSTAAIQNVTLLPCQAKFINYRNAAFWRNCIPAGNYLSYVASVDTFKICYDSARRLNQSRVSGVLQSKLVWSL